MNAATTITAVLGGLALGRTLASPDKLEVSVWEIPDGRAVVRGSVAFVRSGPDDDNLRLHDGRAPSRIVIENRATGYAFIKRADGIRILIIRGAVSAFGGGVREPVIVIGFKSSFTVEPEGAIRVTLPAKRLTSTASASMDVR